MNRKITFPELVEMIAKATNTSTKVSELFLKELFGIVSQSLIEGEVVKIKNIGTFKVGDVDAHQIVNAATGEGIDVPSHKKVFFVPDKYLADAVNLPFANFEAVELSDEITDEQLQELDDDKTAEEPVVTEPVADTEQSVADVPEAAEPIEEANADEEPEIEKETEADQQSEPEPEPEEEGCGDYDFDEEPTPEDIDSVEQQMVKDQTPAPMSLFEPDSEGDTDHSNGDDEPRDEVQESQEKDQEERAEATPQSESMPVADKLGYNPKEDVEYVDSEDVDEEIAEAKVSSFWKGYCIGFLVALVLTWLGMYYYYNYVKTSAEPAEPYVEDSNTAVAADSLATDSVVPAQQVKDEPVAETEDPVAEVKEEPKVAAEPVKPSGVVRDTVRTNYFLTRMARKHYGNNNFWVYIYEENKSKISNPNRVPIGTVVVVPPASKYGIDKNNPECVDKAKKKSWEILRNYQ